MDRIADCARLLEDVPFEAMLLKVAEETGEMADAYIGMTGANPRKGVYKTRDDLEKELLDVALTAMVAYTHSRRARGRLCPEPNSFLLRHAAWAAERHRAEVGV